MKRTLIPATFMSAEETHRAITQLEHTDLPYNAYLSRLRRIDAYVRDNGVFTLSESRTLRKRIDTLYEETWNRHPLHKAALVEFICAARAAKWSAPTHQRWRSALLHELDTHIAQCSDAELPAVLVACLVAHACKYPRDIVNATGNRTTTTFFTARS